MTAGHLVHPRPCPAAGHIAKKCMAAGARGIGETSNAVQLNGFFGKIISFIICFLKLQLYLCIYLFFYLSIYLFISLFFSDEYFFKVLV